MAKTKFLLTTHVSYTTYAQLRGITRANVYRAIDEGRIIPDIVGYDKLTLIDIKKYGNVEFKGDESRVNQIPYILKSLKSLKSKKK